MTSIRVSDDGTGTAPIVEKGRETPFKQGTFYVFEVKDEVAKYWNKLPPARRDELYKQSKKERKDLRQLLDDVRFQARPHQVGPQRGGHAWRAIYIELPPSSKPCPPA